MRNTPNGVLPADQARVLGALLELARGARPPWCTRALADRTGYSRVKLHRLLHRLRRRQLVAFEDRRQGTLCPRVRWVPLSALAGREE